MGSSDQVAAGMSRGASGGFLRPGPTCRSTWESLHTGTGSMASRLKPARVRHGWHGHSYRFYPDGRVPTPDHTSASREVAVVSYVHDQTRQL